MLFTGDDYIDVLLLLVLLLLLLLMLLLPLLWHNLACGDDSVKLLCFMFITGDNYVALGVTAAIVVFVFDNVIDVVAVVAIVVAYAGYCC